MKSASRECDVICLGLVGADHVCEPIPQFPAPGTLVSTPGLTLAVGGSAANVSVDLARLEVRVRLFGRVGDDWLGDFLRRELETANVDCSGLAQSSTAQTATTLAINVGSEDRRFIHAHGANAELTGTEVTPEDLERCRVLCVGGLGLNPKLSGENVSRLFQTARDLDVTTVLDVVLGDPQRTREMLEHILPWTDVFVPNEDEARAITGISDARQQAKQFIGMGARTAVITRAAWGAVMWDANSTEFEVAAFPVNQVDSTGGGDAFLAGFVFGLLRGKPASDCLTWGAAMGASCVRANGATAGVFTADELMQFVAEQAK